MELNETKNGNFLVVQLPSRLDTSNYTQLEGKLISIIEKGEKEIVVDCSGLLYISSSGLRVLLMALKKTSSLKGKLHLCCLQENIREIFEISGFNSIFSIFPTLEEALA